MWNDGSEFEHFMTDPWAAHPVVNPKTVCFKGGGGQQQDPSYYANIERDKQVAEANARRAEESARQARIRAATDEVNTRFDSMFTPDFYKAREKAYIDYYRPQLDDQFADAQKKLTYWLADRGLLESSARNDKTADLTKLFDTGVRQISSGALDLSNKTKGDVERTRASLIADARDSADPTYSGGAATSSMQALAQPESFSPLADMFATFTGALGQQAALERASALSGGAIRPAFNTGLFGGDSVRVLA